MSQPAWAIATLFPLQGTWSEEEYLDFSDRHRRVEFDDGEIEVLPVPTRTHQRILAHLLGLLRAYADRVDGRWGFAGTRLKLPGNKYREPDLLFATKRNAHFEGEERWTGADLVMEVVSGGPEDHTRDFVKKRGEYARGAVAEYWLIEPETKSVLVLALRGDRYVEHGTFTPGEVAASPSLPGFAVDVAEMFLAASAGA